MSAEGQGGTWRQVVIRTTEIKVPKIGLQRVDINDLVSQLRSVLETAKNLDAEGGRILRERVERVIGYPGSSPTHWMLEEWISSLDLEKDIVKRRR